MRGHVLHADEPVGNGGADSGPTAHELLLSSLGACTAITLRMYAARKGWSLDDVDVRLRGRHEGDRYIIERRIRVVADLGDAERTRLLEIANRCPVHRTLTGEIVVETMLVSD